MMRFNDLTADLSGSPIGDGLVERLRGTFSRGFRRALAARQASAELKISSYLNRHSDEELGDLGFNPHEIKAIRRQAAREPRLFY